MSASRMRLLACAVLLSSACSGVERRPRDPVSPDPPLDPVARVIITQHDILLVRGGYTYIWAYAQLESGKMAYDVYVQWTSRNPAIASINSSRVTANAVGSTYLVATIANKSDSASVTVFPPENPPPSIVQRYVWPDTSSLIAGMRRQLRVEEFNYATGVRYPTGVTWSSGDAAVASVDSMGMVTAHAIGQATITAKLDSHSVVAQVFVSSYPAPLAFASVSVGRSNACAVTTSGDAYCWGTPPSLKLPGTGPTDRCETIERDLHLNWIRGTGRCSARPVKVPLPEAVREISTGDGFTCALGVSNTARCWGYFSYTLTLSEVSALPGAQFRTISHRCGLSTSGAAYCWGEDTNGDRGDGPGRTSTFAATPVTGGREWLAISSISNSACALDTQGVPYCWGPVPVTGASGGVSATCNIGCSESPTQVAAGAAYSAVRFSQVVTMPYGNRNCALTSEGTLYCWGGQQTVPLSLRPAVNQPAGGLVNLTSGLGYDAAMCGLTSAGAAHCVRFSSTAPVDSAFRLEPFAVGVPLKSITRGDANGCGLGTDGLLYCWGSAPAVGDGLVTGTVAPENAAKVIGQ